MTQHWDKSVELQLHGTGAYRTVKTTEDAAICLLERWPRGTGQAFFKAQAACLDGLDGKLPAAKVRQAFISAAKEADIHIRSTDDPRQLAMQRSTGPKTRVSFSDGPAWRKANSKAMDTIRDHLRQRKPSDR